MRRGLILCAGALLLAFPPHALAASPETELAQKYAPVVRLVEQTEPCGHGEPYQPADVNAIFGNEGVALRGPWDKTNVVKVAPTAADLATGKAGYALDFPGDPLDPGCTYEEWWKQISAGTQATTYARVVTEEGRPGKLALQYWFFYVFNNFNNKHEGDWEMIQLNFDALDAPAAALETEPSAIGYSQHEGAERAAWGDEKLRLVGQTHPVVYPAAGSHANYFAPSLYLGRSGAQGVGCDDTLEPSNTLNPAVEVIPTDPAAYLRDYPWLGYTGHWGERQPAFYNGPTGPNQKKQWTMPITWSEETWRDASFAMPASSSFGPTATDFFCSAVATGSDALTKLVRDPWATLVLLSLIVLLVLYLGSRTSWRSVPLRLARRRAWGEIINSSRRMYRSEFRLFAGIGLLFVPVGIAISLVQYLLFRLGPLEPLVDAAGASNAAVGVLALGLGVLFTFVGLAIVQATTAAAMAELDAGRRVTPLAAYRSTLGTLSSLLRGLLRAAVIIVLLDLTVIGIPVSMWLLIRWSLFAQVAALEEELGSETLRRSARIVGGHWWKAATITVATTGMGLLVGPLLGVILLFLTSASFNVVNLASSLVYTVTLPFAAIATTYLYHDLRVRERLEARELDVADVLPAEI